MKRCGTCRYFQAGECTWWLQPVQDLPGRACYVSPDADPNYPLVPTPTEEPRRFKYPDPHKRCFVCGAELTGRDRHYCSAGHREMYWARFTWDRLRELIWRRDQKCCLCNTSVTCYEAEIDHITPVALGGEYWDPANLQTLCHDCHSKKTGGDRVELHKKQRREAIIAENYPLDLFMEM